MPAPPTALHPEWDAFVEEIKTRAADREVDLIRRHAKEWSAKGRGQWVCLSPLRAERSPSFYVYDKGRGWHDWGTHESGDLIAFIQRFYHLDFKGALDHLAKEFALPTWEERKAGRGAPVEDAETLLRRWHEEADARRVFAASSALAELCHHALPSQVRAHLREHYGFTDTFIDFERIGYCPEGLWDLVHAVPLPFDDAMLLATGWFHAPAEGHPHAVFGSRITFPYWKDGSARYVIGREYLGRVRREDTTIPDWDKSKYKKLPTHDADKRPYVSTAIENNVLWNEDCLRFMRPGDTLIITEGVTDAAMFAMLGFFVVSPVTTSYRTQDVERVIALLRHYRIEKIVILNDNDVTIDPRTGTERRPGLEGAKRMASGLWTAGLDVRIGRLPKPEGVAKIDVNEIGRNALREGGESHATAVLQSLVAGADVYPEFLASEIPASVSMTDAEAHLSELGAMAERLTPLQREDLFRAVHERIKHVPKKPARKVFDTAVALRAIERKAEEKKAGGAGGAGGGAGATGPEKKKRAPRDTGKLRGHVVDCGTHYERESTTGERERISGFVLVVTHNIVRTDGPDLLRVRVVGNDPSPEWDAGDTLTLVDAWTVPAEAWTSKRSFLKSMPSNRMVWTGTDDDVQGVLELLTSAGLGHVPSVASTTVLGRHVMRDGSLRFVLPWGVLGPDGATMDPPDLVYLPEGGSNLQHRLPTEAPRADAGAVHALMREWFAHAMALHEPEAIAAIAGWFMAGLFGPYLRSELGAAPILNTFATPASGKSSLFQRVFWPTFVGVQRGELMSCTPTQFTLTRDLASANALPLVFDEYKPSDMGPQKTELFLRFVRRVYTGETEPRGRADQSMNVYFLTALVAVLGESRLEHDQALRERTLYVPLDGNWIRQHPASTTAYRALYGRALHTLAPFLQGWSLTADAPALLDVARARAHVTLAELERGDVADRVTLGITWVAFGLAALDAVAIAVGCPGLAVDFPRVVTRLLAEAFDDTDGGSGRVRDNFDEFFQDAAAMAVLGLVREGTHYVWIAERLCLWIRGIEAARAEWRRSQGLHGATPGHLALARIAAEKFASGTSYITDTSRVTPLESSRVRCVEIDPSKVPASFGLEDAFPCQAPAKTWGGARPGAGAPGGGTFPIDWAGVAGREIGTRNRGQN